MDSGQRKITHISLLNPALHSRIYYKMALSQVALGYRVSIIAQDPADAPYEKDGVRIVPIASVARLSLDRLKMRRRLIRLAEAERPDLLQVHAPELLPGAMRLRRKLPNLRLVYDVHEDYRANMLHGGTVAPWLRSFMAARIRRAEKRAARVADGIFYAERCFDNILDGEPDKVVVLENKFRHPRPPFPPSPANPRPIILHTGTLAENWGVMRTLELWKKVNAHLACDLVVAGHGHDKAFIDRIRKFVALARLEDRFSLLGGTEYLPYEKVLAEINRCSIGTGLYVLRPNIEGRIPTKFYEFMAARKPLLFTSRPDWDEMNTRLDFGRALHFPLAEAQVLEVVELLKQPEDAFYRRYLDESEYSWMTEREKLEAFLSKLWP